MGSGAAAAGCAASGTEGWVELAIASIGMSRDADEGDRKKCPLERHGPVGRAGWVENATVARPRTRRGRASRMKPWRADCCSTF